VRVVYDAGALIAAERADPRLLVLHRRALQGRAPRVSATVLGQVWRGSARQASLSRVLAGCEVDPLDVFTAKEGGQLCGAAGTSDIVDAVVVVLARRYGAAVVTSDPGDITHLASVAGWHIPLFVV
jgi:predicted nucleic acid-binding protein